MNMETQTAYLAPEGYTARLAGELEGVLETRDRLVLTDRPPQPTFWVRNTWLNPVVLRIASINDAARQLKAIQRNWCLYSSALHRRAALIQEKLPHVSARPLKFPSPLPQAPLGSWTLLDTGTVLASPRCSNPFPNGEIHFEEDRTGPPSRAYLKLWEAWTRVRAYPKAGEFCIDAGGSPGGWCWAIQALGARVLSVDRSSLDPRVLALPGVEFKQANAFSLKPQAFDRVDWIFSDVVCYPEKLYEWVTEWVDSGRCGNLICTLKFQGEYQPGIVRRFAQIPGSQVLHLFHNKHELTWIRLAGEEKITPRPGER